VEGASGYRIIVRGPDLFWTEEVGSVTKLLYPNSAPELKPGVDYKLIVVTNGHSSADEPGLGLGFSILSSQDRKAISLQQRKIENLGLASGPTHFIVAQLYAAHGLKSEAIQQLEDVSKSFQRSAVYRVLGDLYLAAGLIRQAEAAYNSFLNLSRNEGDQEGEMLAHFSLGRIYAALGNRELARKHLDVCTALANRIGDRQTAGRAESQLAELND
jgi:tetratricopeptide (TPR) repeat protein